MNHRGTPDVNRGARYIVKDYTNGKLVYCYPPPGYEEKSFQEHKIDPIKEAKYFGKCKKIEQRVLFRRILFIFMTNYKIFFLTIERSTS
jgi:hypothetical protein